MGYIFRIGLHACDAGGSLVFLDLPADRYFALSGRANEACRRLISGSVNAGDAVIIQELVINGILVSMPDAIGPSLCQPIGVVHSSNDEENVTVGKGRTMLAAMRHAFAIAELKLRGLDPILQGVQRQKRRMHASRTRRTVHAADLGAAFRAADRLISPNGRCLARSIALARAMIANGIEPELVLGIKLRPFEAHCWVQHGDFLVSDDTGVIAPFTPILIV